MAKHAKHAKRSFAITKSLQSSQGAAPEKIGRHQKVSSNTETTGRSPGFVSPTAEIHWIKSRRMRLVLTIVSVILVFLIAALAYFAFTLINEASNVAAQNADSSDSNDAGTIASDAGVINTDSHGDVPDLVNLLGLSVDEAIEEVGRGATITSERDITEEVSDGEDDEDVETQVVGRNVTVTLADESTDSSGNVPSLYFETDEDDIIVSVGYSTPVSLLNYGDVAFEDIVQESHIIENLLVDAGLIVDTGTIELPSVDDYRTYGDDGQTIVRESYTFSGSASDSDGVDHDWTCRLSYDYSTANVSNSLTDTIKLIQVYIYA